MVAKKRKMRVISKQQLVKLLDHIGACSKWRRRIKAVSVREAFDLANRHRDARMFFVGCLGLWIWQRYSFSQCNRAAIAYCRKHKIK